MITVITPCSRPELLPLVRVSVPTEAQWIVVLDAIDVSRCPGVLGAEVHCIDSGAWGNQQRNLGLTYAKGDHVVFLDDDNALHPKLLEHACDDVVMMRQVYPDGRTRLRAEGPVRTGRCDTAQFILPRELAQAYRWHPTLHGADGMYFSEVYRFHPERFRFIDEPGAYYNYLR